MKYMDIIKCPKGILLEDFEKIMAVHELILKDYSKPIPHVNELVDIVNMSPQKFRGLFRKIFSKNYYEYYQEIRLEHAKQLLAQNKFTVVQISYKVGFTYSQNFARAFAKYTGMTAKEFKSALL